MSEAEYHARQRANALGNQVRDLTTKNRRLAERMAEMAIEKPSDVGGAKLAAHYAKALETLIGDCEELLNLYPSDWFEEKVEAARATLSS